MSWDDIEPRVHLLLDGRLDEAAANELLGELHSSPELRQRYVELQAVVVGLRQFRAEGAPEGFADRVRASIAAGGFVGASEAPGAGVHGETGRRLFSILTWMAPIAAAMLLSSAAWMLLGSDPTSHFTALDPVAFDVGIRDEAKAGPGESGRWMKEVVRVEKKTAEDGSLEAPRPPVAADDRLKAGSLVPPSNNSGGLDRSGVSASPPGAAKRTGGAEPPPDLQDKVSNPGKDASTEDGRGDRTIATVRESSAKDPSRGLVDGAEARRDDPNTDSLKKERRQEDGEEEHPPARELLAALVDALSRKAVAPASAQAVVSGADAVDLGSTGVAAGQVDERSVTVFLHASRKRAAVDPGASTAPTSVGGFAPERMDPLDWGVAEKRMEGASGSSSLTDLPEPIRASVETLIARQGARVFVLGTPASDVSVLITQLSGAFDVQALVAEPQAAGGDPENGTLESVTERLGGAPSVARWADVSPAGSTRFDAEAMVWSPDFASLAVADAGLRSLFPPGDAAAAAAGRGLEETSRGDGPIVAAPSLRLSPGDSSKVPPPEGFSKKDAAPEPSAGSTRASSGPVPPRYQPQLGPAAEGGVRVRVVVIVEDG